MTRTKYRIKRTATGYEVATIGAMWTKKTSRPTFWAACKEVWRQQFLFRP